MPIVRVHVHDDTDAGGDLDGKYVNPVLVDTGVTADTYGSSTEVPVITVDAKGRLTTVTTATISSVTVDTRSNIQATTPANGTIGFTTDTTEMALYYGGSWYFQPLKMIVRSGNGIDMGYTQDNSLIGIDADWISQKTLSDIYIGSNVDTTNASSTRIPLRASGGTLQIYVSGAWQTIVSNFVFSENSAYGYALEHTPVGFTRKIEVMTGNSLNDLGLNGLPMTHSYTNDMGPYPAGDWIGGREISAT